MTLLPLERRTRDGWETPGIAAQDPRLDKWRYPLKPMRSDNPAFYCHAGNMDIWDISE